jgi:hypothetical protein
MRNGSDKPVLPVAPVPTEGGTGRQTNHSGLYIPHSAMYHAMNHVRFMISPELHVVQDGGAWQP